MSVIQVEIFEVRKLIEIHNFLAYANTNNCDQIKSLRNLIISHLVF